VNAETVPSEISRIAGIGWLRSGFACLTSVMVLESVIRPFSNVFLPGGALRHPKVPIEDNVASPN
jgi:hypothetical protein